MVEEQNKQGKGDNQHVSTSSESECQINSPVLNIQLTDSTNYDQFLNSLNQKHKPSIKSYEHNEIVESIERRFKLQIKKQKELFQIVQTKLKQQNQFLVQQNLSLKNLNQSLSKKLKQTLFASKLQSKHTDQNSPLVLAQMENLRIMLGSLQKEHENCISGKKQLIDQKQTLEMKIIILKNQNNELQAHCKDLKTKIQSFTEVQTLNNNLKSELQLLRKEVISLRVTNQQQERQFSKELSCLQEAINDIKSKNLVPEIHQKLVSFSNEQSHSAEYQLKSRNSPNFIYSKPDVETSHNFLSGESFYSDTKRSLLNDIGKSSLTESTLCYSGNTKFDETQVIKGLYQQNCSILRQKQINSSIQSIRDNSLLNQSYSNQNVKPRSFHKKNPSKSQKADNCLPFLTKQLTFSSKVSRTSPCFRYL